jgi:hypothetical protein
VLGDVYEVRMWLPPDGIPPTVKVPGIATFCEASILIAVVPAPVPVFILSVPVLSDETDKPSVALPALISDAI